MKCTTSAMLLATFSYLARFLSSLIKLHFDCWILPEVQKFYFSHFLLAFYHYSNLVHNTIPWTVIAFFAYDCNCLSCKITNKPFRNRRLKGEVRVHRTEMKWYAVTWRPGMLSPIKRWVNSSGLTRISRPNQTYRKRSVIFHFHGICGACDIYQKSQIREVT